MVKLLAPERRPLSVERQRARDRLQLRGVDLGDRVREIPVGVRFRLYDDALGPEYVVHELRVKGTRAYATVEQLDGYGAGHFTVGMRVRVRDGELVALLPGI